MLLEIKRYAQQIINNMSVRKIPLYLLSALVLFYCAPTFALFSGIATSVKFIFALAIAPIVFEVLSRTFGWEPRIARVIPLVSANPAQIMQDIRQRNDNRAILAVNHINRLESLVNFGIEALSNPNVEVFNAIYNRLQTISANAPASFANRLLRAAVFHNRPDCVRVLLNNDAVRNNAHAMNNQALREVCRNGSNEIFEDLMMIPSVVNNATFNHNEALRIAEREGHYELIGRLLLYPFVENYHTPDDADLENFTPRNEEEFTINGDNIVVPQVTPQPNVPLNVRLSSTMSLLNALLNQRMSGLNSDVREGGRRRSRRSGISVADNRNDFVDNPDDNELSHVANHGEGSMQPLNQRQEQALIDMHNKYRAAYNRKGEAVIFQEIRTHLINEYNRNPARARNGMHNLSLNRDIWNYFSDDVPYHKHHVHTAYRYLFLDPNPWRAPGGRGNELTIEDKTNIAYMWLAATTTDPIPDGQTRESLITEFVTAIYELCRAHNFDRSRTVSKTRINQETGLIERYEVTENYDDEEGDKPTCGGGVKQRSTQFYMVFLNDRPETRPLTPDVMNTTFKQEMINESTTPGGIYSKLTAMSTESLNKAYAALENKYILWDDITADDQRLLDSLNLSEEDIGNFITHCNKYFGEARIAQERSGEEALRYGISDRFNNYEALIRHLSNDAVGKYCADIMRNITNIVTARTGNKPPSAEDSMPGTTIVPVVFSSQRGANTTTPPVVASNDDPTSRPTRKSGKGAK